MQKIDYLKQWGDIAIKLLAPPAGGRFFMYTWRWGDESYFSVELQYSNLYFRSEDWPIVDWVRALLPGISAALGAAASAYDQYRPDLFLGLELDEILTRLRDGRLFAPVPLSHYTIRADCVDTREVRELARQHVVQGGTRYSESTLGYHVFDNLF